MGVLHHVRAVLRRSAVGAVLITVLAACATSPRPGPTAGSGPASSTPAAPVVRVFSPWSADGSPAVAVTATASGSCWTTSVAAPSPHTYRCLAASAILDPCFARPGDTSQVVCVADPWSPARVVTLTTPLPTAAPLAVRRPWALELANGVRCTAVSGMVPQADGVDLDYTCGSASGAGSATGSGGSAVPVTVEYGPVTGPLTRVGVTTVWRAG